MVRVMVSCMLVCDQPLVMDGQKKHDAHINM